MQQESEAPFFDNYAGEFKSFLLLLKALFLSVETVALIFLENKAVLK
jgi:hypothetical protein